MLSKLRIPNPKRRIRSEIGKAGWYDYYAGYSSEFVRHMFTDTHLPEGSTILDPWNGSGTTSQIAEEAGFSVFGYDINPVMIVIAKARRLNSSVRGSLVPLCFDIVKKAKQYRKMNFISPEPLEIWLHPESASTFRKIDRAIQTLLINRSEYERLVSSTSMERLSSLAAFFYVALFKTLRETLIPFKCSNPTWIKEPKETNSKIKINSDEIYNKLHYQVSKMAEGLSSINVISGKSAKTVTLEVASSLKLPLDMDKIGMVLTSPPYCTRIDYAVATKPELALLGLSMDEGLKKLRQLMIGTPTISKETLNFKTEWGHTCSCFLNKVSNHYSKASNSYYYKTFLQYFNSIYESLKEINRTLKKGGIAIFVVQDSYYKDIHINLSNIFIEMGFMFSWHFENKVNFKKNQTMVGINKQAANYRKASDATESVLLFRKV